MIEWVFHQSSQLLGLLAFVGMLAGLYKWRTAVRKDYLLSFIVFMAGTALREGVVYVWGNNQWGDSALILSLFARLVQVAGSVLFIRAIALDVGCPRWAIAAFILFVTLFVMAV